MRLPVPRLLLLACAALAVLLVPASAMAKTKRTYPVIKTVTPMKIAIGAQLTIKGSGFKAGKGKNSVVFKRDGKPAVFVKSGLSTKKKLYVTVPDKLAAFLGADSGGTAVPTRFRLRVLSSRFSKHFTSTKLSPIVKPKAGSASTPAGTYQECQDKAKVTPDADVDADGLTNGTELAYSIDPCTADTDGDGVPDGYEFWSASDLNGSAHPFPGKAPYPNALDSSDTDLDFDGDGLTLKMEYQAWRYTGSPQPLSYSDGNPYTGGTVLRDGDKDVDSDGLTNFQETIGPMRIGWWTAIYDGTNGPKESVYPDAARRFVEPSFVDPDSDGDTFLDGEDDQDHDGYPNWYEVTRPADWATTYTSTKFPWHVGTHGHDNPLARVQPFNPCKPIWSDACHNPFPTGYYPVDEDWFNNVRPIAAPLMGPTPGSRL